MTRHHKDNQEAQESRLGVHDASSTYHAPPTPNVSWGAARSPFDTEGDGGEAKIALPVNFQHPLNDDEGHGFHESIHPGDEPDTHSSSDEIKAMTPDECYTMLNHLLEKERNNLSERDRISLEKDKFSLEKDKSQFNLVKSIVTGFSILMGFAFVVLIGILAYMSINTSTADTVVITAILKTVSDLVRALVFPL